MWEFTITALSGPMLPASVLVALVLLFWLLVILGAVDAEGWNLNLDVDVDAPTITGVGFVILRFFNLGRIPLLVWLSIFALTWWVFSALFDDPAYRIDRWLLAQALVRNIAISAFLTKLFTSPLTGVFDEREAESARQLVGRACIITTAEANDAAGQAQVAGKGAPLLVNVRTISGTLHKGDEAEIVEYDAARRLFVIEPKQASS